MKKSIAALLLGTMIVTSTMSGGVALAQSADADPYPFCQALDLPPPPDPAAPAAAPATAPANAAASTPNATNAAAPAAPVAAASATAAPAAASAPAAPPAPPPPPTIDNLLKSTTDVNKIVDTLLDAYAPIGANDYDQLFQAIVAQVQSSYIDPSKVSALSSLPRQYRGKIKSREDLDRALYAVAAKLGDLATSYMSAPDRLQLMLKASVQKVAFFGLHLRAASDGSYRVISIEPGSTADLNGFRVGDTLVSVNGKPLKGLSKTDAEGLELNPVGNQMQVSSMQDGQQVDRSYMLQANVPYKPAMSVMPGSVGYIKLPQQVSDQLMGAVVKNLVKMQLTTNGGLAGITLDLRYVNAASVRSMGALMPILISQGVVLHEQVLAYGGSVLQNTTDSVLPMPAYAKSQYTSEQRLALDALRTMPLVIIVNGSTSAPGAEQLAVALREGRPNTTIVGESTPGNGVETTSYKLPNCGTITVPTKRYTTAQGLFLGDVGLHPDIEVLPSRNAVDEGDVQLARALGVVQSKSAYRPANLVMTDQTTIPALGPAPKQAEPAVDIDWQRVAYENKAWLEKGLVLVMLLMCLVLLYWVRKGPGKGGGGTNGSGGKRGRLVGLAGKAFWRLRRNATPLKGSSDVAKVVDTTGGAGKAFWRRRSWGASKGAQPAAVAVLTSATVSDTLPDLPPAKRAAPATTRATVEANSGKETTSSPSFRLPKFPRLVKRTTTSEIEMTNKVSGFFGHVAVRGTLGALFLAVSLSGLYAIAQRNGGIQMDSASAGITYMTSANMRDLIGLKQVAKGKFTAGLEDKAVLVVECAKEACEDEDLALAAVASDLKDSVVVVAIDPYTDSKVALSFEKTFVGPAVVDNVAGQMAVAFLQSQKQPVTPESLQQVMQMPQFQAALQNKLQSSGILQPVYPKFLLFAPKDFSLVLAASGLSDKDSVEGLVKSGLAQLKALAAQAAAPAVDPAAAPAAPAAAPATPAPVAATPTPTPTPATNNAVAAPAAAAPPAVPNNTATPAIGAPAAPQTGKQP